MGAEVEKPARGGLGHGECQSDDAAVLCSGSRGLATTCCKPHHTEAGEHQRIGVWLWHGRHRHGIERRAEGVARAGCVEPQRVGGAAYETADAVAEAYPVVVRGWSGNATGVGEGPPIPVIKKPMPLSARAPKSARPAYMKLSVAGPVTLEVNVWLIQLLLVVSSSTKYGEVLATPATLLRTSMPFGAPTVQLGRLAKMFQLPEVGAPGNGCRNRRSSADSRSPTPTQRVPQPRPKH